jgi:hypothetical protein
MTDPDPVRTTVKVTAMKYRGFYARREFEVANMDEALALGKAHNWDHELFEPTGDWVPVQSLLLDSEDAERLVDLEPFGDDAISALREFVDDVKLAHGTGEGDAIDKAGLDWPDLALTYEKAGAVLACRPADPARIKRTVCTAIYEHDYGTDVRVFRTEAQAEAWRNEIAKEWWDNEFPDEERPGDAEIGARYFDRMRDGGDEYFTIEACAVE